MTSGFTAGVTGKPSSKPSRSTIRLRDGLESEPREGYAVLNEMREALTDRDP